VGGTFIPNFGTLGLRVLELFGMYATDGQTDGRTDRRTNRQKATLTVSFPTGGGIITGGRFPQILNLSQGLKIGVPSGCLKARL